MNVVVVLLAALNCKQLLCTSCIK